MFFKLFSSSLNSSIIIYFFEGVKGNGLFGILKKFCFDVVPKSLYLFVSDISNSAELYSMEFHSADGSDPKGKLNFFL